MERQISLSHFALTLLFAVAVIAFERSAVLQVGELHFLAPPPEHMELMHFGFRESLADSLWLRWIQDNDTCQTYASAMNPNPIQPSVGEFANPRHKFCDNSWSFKMLDAVTKLAPRFKMPYLAGAVTLSVLVEDYEGAKVIFDRGLEQYPTDWILLYRASYHYLFDRQDLRVAADLMDRAAKAGAPSWLTLTAARLYSKTGQMQMGIVTLENFRKSLTKPEQLKEVDRRIAEMKKQLQ
jgi:hypothetical protein